MEQKKSKMSILISNNILGFFFWYSMKNNKKNLTKCHKKQSDILHIVKRKMNQYSIFSIPNNITSDYIHVNKATKL